MQKRFFTATLAFLSSLLSYSALPPSFTSYLGGNGLDYADESAYAITADGAGNIYVGGFTQSQTFPVTKREGANFNGGFITKLSSDGARILYSRFFADMVVRAVVAQPDGHIFALGHAYPADRSYITLGTPAGGETDIILLKLNPDSSLQWAEYLGGSDLELPRGMVLDSAGNVYITGVTASTNFPVTATAPKKTLGGVYDAFVMKLNSAGAVQYSTYLGGTLGDHAYGIAVDSQGRAYVAGQTRSSSFPGAAAQATLGTASGNGDAFVARLNAAGSAVDWVARVGGSETDAAAAVALDPQGNVVLLGMTHSANFPTTAGALKTALGGGSDQFLVKISPSGNSLVYSSFFGGSEEDSIVAPEYINQLNGNLDLYAAGLAVDTNGNIYIGSRTGSEVWPANIAGVRRNHGGTESYYAKINPSGSAVLDLRFLGGGSTDGFNALSLDATGNVLMAGGAERPYNFPFLVTTTGTFQPAFAGNVSDATFAKIGPEVDLAPNNHFANRTLIAGRRAAGSSVIDSATTEGGEPLPVPSTKKSVWFRWLAPSDGTAIISTEGSDFDTTLACFTGSTIGSLTPLGSNDDQSSELQTSFLKIPVKSNTEYNIQLGGKEGAEGVARVSVMFSQVPNDNFENAQLLTGPAASGTRDNTSATWEPGEPFHAGLGNDHSLWWKWVAPGAADIAINTFGSSNNTFIAVYTGTALSNLVEVASNNDASETNRASEVTFRSAANQTYYIAVDTLYNITGTIIINIVPNTPPANDNFAAAAVISGLSTNVVGSNANATREENEPELVFTDSSGNIDKNYARKSVWWKWTAPQSGRLVLNTTGSSFDTRLGLYKGASISTLELVASNNDINFATRNLASRLQADVTGGDTYYILIDGGLEYHSGVVNLAVNLTFPPRILPESVARNLTGGLTFNVAAPVGRNYRLETSKDFKTWTQLPANYSGGNFILSTPASTESPQFYRLVDITP